MWCGRGWGCGVCVVGGVNAVRKRFKCALAARIASVWVCLWVARMVGYNAPRTSAFNRASSLSVCLSGCHSRARCL